MAIKEFMVVRSTNKFVFFKARHVVHGNVILKCCHQNAPVEIIAQLNWEYHVTRELNPGRFIIPLETIYEFESSPFGLVFSEFRNLQHEVPFRNRNRRDSYSNTDSSIEEDSDMCISVFTTVDDNQFGTTIEYIQMSLGDYLQRYGVLNMDNALLLLSYTVSALKDLHNRGIMFRNFSFNTLLLEFPSFQSEFKILNWKDLRVKLCDFTHASKLTGELVPHSVVDFVIFGDMRFMSPESTGRMNRAIDVRSDFYSLGMLIHGALTDSVPPANASILNLLHYHLAVVPVPLLQYYANEEIATTKSPQFIQKATNIQLLLDRLIAKLPEDRYQTCDDILHDLNALIDSAEAMTDFLPRLAWKPEDALSQKQLYGRKNEIEQLRNFQTKSYTSAAGGVAVITGVSGVGKTTVVQELILPAFSMGGIYCSGKFDQFKRDLPFVPFIQAFTDMVNLLLLEDSVRLETIVDQIHFQLQENIMVLLSLIPNLSHLLDQEQRHAPITIRGQQQKRQEHHISEILSTLTPSETLIRMHSCFTTLLETVSSYKPLTLFIDDVQWADWSTSQYIRHLLDNGIPSHILLVLSYRSDEIHSNQYLHDLESVLHAHKNSGQIQLYEQSLLNMGVGTIAEMLDDIFQRKAMIMQVVSTDILATLTYEKTLGNPYYVKRFLQMLLDSGALTRSDDNSSWTVNMEQMRHSAPMENVADMLVSQLQVINSATKLILKIASVIGTEFDLYTVAQVLRCSHTTIWTRLMPAISSGYLRVVNGASYCPVNLDNSENFPFDNLAAFAAHILPKGGRVLARLDEMHIIKSGICFKLDHSPAVSEPVVEPDTCTDNGASISTIGADIISDESETVVRYQWEHDRVQQAAYQLINSNVRNAVHYAVGTWMLYTTSMESMSDHIFDLIHHLEVAKTLFSDPQDKLNLAKLFLIAANRARSCSAFGSAEHYSSEAVNILDESVWDSDYEFAFFTHISLLENQYANGQSQAMKAHIDVLHDRKLQQQSRILVYEQEILYYVSLGQLSDGIECGLKALDMLGYQLSTDPLHIAELIKKATRSSAEVIALVDLPLLTDPVAQAAVRILVGLWTCICYVRPNLTLVLILTLVDISISKGNSDFGAFGYALWAMLLSCKYDNVALGGDYCRVGRAIIDKLPPSALKCNVYATTASYVQFWSEPLSIVQQSFDMSISVGKQTYNFQYIAYTTVRMLYYRFISGHSLDMLKADLKIIEGQMELYNIPVAIDYRRILEIMVTHLSMKKLTSLADYLSPALEKTMVSSTVNMLQFTYWFGSLTLYYLADDLESAQHAADELDKIRDNHPKSLIDTEHVFFKALVAARVMIELDDRESTKKTNLMQVLQTVINDYKSWAEYCVSTFGCRLALLQGCELWLQGDLSGGLNQLDIAIQLAQQHGFQNVEALANEMTGRFWIRDKKRHIATVYMSSAHRAYKAWGAEWKAQLIGHYDAHSYENIHDTSCLPDGQNIEQKAALSRNQVDEVDVEMLCDWTIALASEKTHDSLLEQFIRLAMLYTGSRKGHMLWTNSDKLEPSTIDDMSMYVYSTIDENGSLCTVLRPNDIAVPMSPIANYTIRTREIISESSPVLTTFTKSGQLLPPPGSFLFYPVVHHGVCVGLLYLSNDLSQKVFFNTKRMSLLKLLSSQLNISFENMRLLEELRTYNEILENQALILEETVSQRTSELKLINQQLTVEVAERKRAEAVAVQAASANRSFLHNMSHELRTPLNCIIGMSELLSQTELSEDQTEILGPILLSAKDLLQLINDILDLSKIESGKLTITKHPFSLREVVDNSLESIVAISRKKQITVAALFPVNVPYLLQSDSTRIGQVLRNLLSNAIKFTQQGDITLTVNTSIVENSNYLCYTIKCIDTGIGIPADSIDRLFKPFSQVNSSTTKKFGGTGLGLNISRNLATMLGGDLTCTSVFNQGSTFIFSFLAELQADASVKSTLPADLTFIICHSKAVVREMVKSYLDTNGARFVEADMDMLRSCYTTSSPPLNSVFILDEQTVDSFASSVPGRKIILTNREWPLEHTADPYTAYIRYPIRCDQLTSAVIALFHIKAQASSFEKVILRAQFSLSVLVAEDNPVNRLVVERMLGKFGIKIDAVENGQLAVEACQKQKYDLVFMDVMMPIMDGHEATMIVRRILPTDHQPIIIALTANAFLEDRVICLNAGMDDVLTKPLTFGLLEAMLLKHFKPTR